MPLAPGNSTPVHTGILSTLNDDGSRRWLKPRPSSGRFLSARRLVAYGLILIFTAIPYLRLHGKPLVLLDIPTRHFTILGHTFLPTDTLLLALFMVGVFITVFLLTALLGRVWCGWGCPQTVYMEFVFRPIERFFEGTPGRARKGSFVGSPLASALKYISFFVVSCYLAHTFLAYFVGVEKLAVWVRSSPFEHPTSFIVMAGVTLLMMFDFTFFREQTCIVACPYGRFQSVMLDRQSIIVSYDRERGEPRGRAKPVPLTVGQTDKASARGDCVDCSMCVTTCPTGIDIRSGLQMECIHCAQCIDACDTVMAKIGKPLGLIRYTSQAALAHEPRKRIRPRVIVYPALLTLVSALFVTVLLTKGPVEMTVLRGRGAPFTTLENDQIANTASIKLLNRTDEPSTYTLSVSGVEGAWVRSEESPIKLAPGEVRAVPVMLVAPLKDFQMGKLNLNVVLSSPDGKFSVTRSFRLVGPGSTHAAVSGGAP